MTETKDSGMTASDDASSPALRAQEELFTPGPWALIAPQPTGATEPGVSKWDRDPEEYEIRSQPAPFMRGFTHTIAIVLGEANARLVVTAPMLHEALKKLAFVARTSGGVAGRDDELCAACERAETVLAMISNQPRGLSAAETPNSVDGVDNK